MVLELDVPQGSSLGEHFTSRASAGGSCRTLLYPVKYVSPRSDTTCVVLSLGELPLDYGKE